MASPTAAGRDRPKGALSQDVESRTLIVSLTLPVKEQWQEAEETAERLGEVSQEVISALMKTQRREKERMTALEKEKKMEEEDKTKEGKRRS